MKKKLLVIGKSLGGGGSEVTMIEFLNHINLLKYDVTLLLLDHDDEYKNRLKSKVKVEYINFDKKYYHRLVSMYSLVGKIIKKLKLNNSLNIYNFVVKHIRLSESVSYDIALDFYGYGSFTTEVLAKVINSKKKATWLHDAYMPWLKNTSDSLKYIDYVFCVSESVKKSFIKKYPKYKDNAKVLYNFIDKREIIKKANQEYDIELERGILNILTVGRLTEQKGYDVAIQAAKYLMEKKINFKWYAIGEGKKRKELEKEIRKANLEKVFILLGRRDNPYIYMKNCDIYVQPSRHEGYCTTITEALTIDKVVIASNIPENQEQIINNKTGLLVDLDAQKIAKKIIKIKNDKKLRLGIEKRLMHIKNKSNTNVDVVNTLF